MSIKEIAEKMESAYLEEKMGGGGVEVGDLIAKEANVPL